MLYMQIISATKYIVRKESTRDHVDLLLSSQCWPTVYAVDMACDVVAHMEVHEPQLASALWGDRWGRFEVPSASIPPKVHELHVQKCKWSNLIHIQNMFAFADCTWKAPTPYQLHLMLHCEIILTAGRFCTLSTANNSGALRPDSRKSHKILAEF